MKFSKQVMTLTIFLVMGLFAITNSMTYMMQSASPNMGNLTRSIIFALVLYGWALVRLLSGKRFAIPFMDFINVVYGMGFVSNIAIAATKLSGTGALVVIALSIVGIGTTIFASFFARKFRSQAQTLVG